MLEPEAALLTGRVAVVTGAANGIGRATALVLARFGADVAVCDRDSDNLTPVAQEIQAAGRRSLAGVFDVRDEPEAEAFLLGVSRALGPIEILVNNAGGTFASPFMDVKAKGEEALVRENFSSVTSFIRHTVPLMPETGGSIVNVTSIEAHRAAPGYAIYAAMKAAVENLSRSLALELGSRLIRVNCVAPDAIPTPGVGELVEARTPLPVRAHADDVAAAIVYLAGDLSRFVTGSTIHVDGGNHAAGGWRRSDDGSWTP